MKSFAAEERSAYQQTLSTAVSLEFPQITWPIQFIYDGVGEADWLEAIQTCLEYEMPYSFHSAAYNPQSNILKIVITTRDLKKYKLRNEKQVLYIRHYVKTSKLVIEHVPQTPHELFGQHKFLQYDESDDDWQVALAVWNALTALKPIFQGAAPYNGNKALEVHVMSKNKEEQRKHEDLIINTLSDFGKREFIHFTHIPVTLQEFNLSIISVDE
jgi:hypothetical protein